jgi:hypothetical protein
LGFIDNLFIEALNSTLLLSIFPVGDEPIQRLKDIRSKVKAPRIVEMINVLVDIEIVLQRLVEIWERVEVHHPILCCKFLDKRKTWLLPCVDKLSILESIALIDAEGYEDKYESTKYDLLHNGRRYPPKYIISMAYQFVSGAPHPVAEFSGGRETNDFLEQRGFSIVDKTGRIIGISIQTEAEDDTHAEGKEKYRQHKSYERNALLSKNKKQKVMRVKGKLCCEVCEFDFHNFYGERGYGFIECHHNKPVSEMEGESEVSLDELSLLCSNCHRMIHRVRPWISVGELRDQISGDE